MYGRSYGILCRVHSDGEVAFGEDSVAVKGSTRTRLLLRVYNPEEWANGEDAVGELLALNPDFEWLMERHSAAHGELFDRCEINLFPEGEPVDCTSGELADRARASGTPDVALIQQLTDYGRYLLISSTGALPANLQGVWNGDYSPPWQCDYTMDENIEMNYWLAFQGNLSELPEAYYGLFLSQQPQWRENARKLFDCGGVLAPIKSTVDALSHHQNREWIWPFWTAGAGWIASLFYEHYLFTGDENLLREETVPLLEEIAAFYSDYFQLDENGKYYIAIGISPENTPQGRDSMLAPNPTMEFAVAKEVLTHLLEAAATLNLPEERASRWREMLGRIPAYQVNGDGALREWMHPDFLDNYHHRHQSHLYPLFPGLEAKMQNDGTLLNACRTAVEKRLVVGLESQTGWSLMHMANLFARLGWRELAWECLRLETERMTGPNLLTYHNHLVENTPEERAGAHFQIDASLGLTSAVQEMLLFSLPGRIDLLPSLPERLSKGEVRGMRCRGGVTVDFRWDMEKGEFAAVLTADRAQTVVVSTPFFTKEIVLAAGVPTAIEK
ncbi:MAG: glycosyl hydrolase family 95 catalytic domain-containing protein [Oscillospiraceae bacterium]